MIRKLGRNGGFTIMELLLAVAIMGILATVGFTVYTTSIKKGRDATRKGDLNQISKALESYLLDNGVYPASCGGKMVACNGAACTWGTSFVNASKTYMATLPADPVASRNFVYAVSADQKSYQLYSLLEYTNDSQANQSGYSVTCSGATACNYGISSSNTTMASALDTDLSCP